MITFRLRKNKHRESIFCVHIEALTEEFLRFLVVDKSRGADTVDFGGEEIKNS